MISLKSPGSHTLNVLNKWKCVGDFSWNDVNVWKDSLNAFSEDNGQELFKHGWRINNYKRGNVPINVNSVKSMKTKSFFLMYIWLQKFGRIKLWLTSRIKIMLSRLK